MWHIVRYSWHYNGIQLHMMCGMRGERDMRHMCGVSCGKREALQLYSCIGILLMYGRNIYHTAVFVYSRHRDIKNRVWQ